jgi:hypothetical protein
LEVGWASDPLVLSVNEVKTLRETDLDKLGQLKIFSWLTSAKMKVLESSLTMRNCLRNEMISEQPAINPSEASCIGYGHRANHLSQQPL